ncbi:unsaturated rhamnogalacturonyl hydrolase [Dyadobacter sp. BE34]|uniref:Unsaturated rhamnogalacturonyl hydrolase n=1 Tax=Dyadobacter fermentans TaxID=94254 RepID=A0ABU1R3K8_9BACT|nr:MULTISPECIES: glycoside hydrolase family 88 protein [Dyadobacter]MDR6807997.1 unsaturated rhamnogalacturonyl hydrolase [Dyadobacter fermentans]MDR7046187.1 unsaturated rhamnogalacturonyl hydrolase [Dyadobacter sp. BE242]MDR7200500.1 unsaturated rhamnogalacturonyl hydrolase [Dyadobacter sp. BE34]MDR7218460.1 unsaturated rhamnogalacturonyl hydrolase [Dyadobacter sp. BE31]MDR7266391.1 unsaturated rhamnogalacturonyl hydrolase [Dyadobacter sp. BE32]
MALTLPRFRKIPLWIVCFTTVSSFAQELPLSRQMADSFMANHKDSILVGKNTATKWDYEQGLMLKAIEKVWYRTGEGKYFEYIRKDIDQYVRADGSIRTYHADEFNIDNIPPGRALLTLYRQSQPDKEKYKKAADLLWKQLEEQPRTKEGGYWHKKRYPNQMWLDGLFMGEPFAAEYSAIFHHPEHFDDIVKQFALIEKYAVDEKTGLVYHAYDESREQKWADKTTGRSPSFWARAIGWYAIALVDVLDYLPAQHPGRAQLIGYLQRLAPVLAKYQDPKSGAWHQVIDQGKRAGNYLEASASCMFVYALAKGARLGYIPEKFAANAQKGYQGILQNFVEKEANGTLSLNKTVSVGGLGGTPYRDGTFEYYLSEPVRKNDLKGIGPFIFASVEMEIIAENAVGKGKTVGLDYYFNHETRKDLTGTPEQFHYTWEDRMHSGFWLWGNTFRELGAQTASVSTPPTIANLKGIDIYIIVDPDTKKETPEPHFIDDKSISEIEKWVKAGGVLVLMANDTANCEIPHFNRLAAKFGIQFTAKNRNMVQGTQFEQGRLMIPTEARAVFPHTEKIYIKELSPLALTSPAKALLTDQGDVIFGISKYGKGTVFAVGDPWLYNEYVDGRRIDTSFENFEAGKDLAGWLLKQVVKK